MKKIIPSLVLLLSLNFVNMFSQDHIATDSIEVSQSASFYKQNGVDLSRHQLIKILKTNPEAYYEYSKASNGKVPVCCVLGFASGHLIGVSAGHVLQGVNKPEIGYAIAGTVLFAITMKLYSSSILNKKNAIRIYNQGLKRQNKSTSLNFNVKSYGIGIRIIF